MSDLKYVISLLGDQTHSRLVTKALGFLAEDIGQAAMNEAIQGIGDRSLTYIKRRTARGNDRYGNPFKNLTAYTTKKKKAMLKSGKAHKPPGSVSPPQSNLYVTGKFYSSLHARIIKGMSNGRPDVVVSVHSTDKGKKVRNITKTREVFGLTQDEEAMMLRAFSREFRSRVTIAKALKARK